MAARVNNYPEKKHLNFTELRTILSDTLLAIPDPRHQSYNNHSLHDAAMCGFACMFFQDPSLLQFQKRLEDERQNNNLRTLFSVTTIPKETQLREIIDSIESEQFGPVFNKFLAHLQRGKHLEQYKLLEEENSYYIGLDATQYYVSYKIDCPKCLSKTKTIKKVETKEYSHQALQASIMHPDKRQVIPLMPEEISNTDGETKQDCELNAAKRLIPRIRHEHPHLGITLGGDGLYSNQPFIEMALEYDMHYILVAKPDNHTYMMDWLRAYPKLNSIEHVDKKGRKHLYEWMNNVPLNGREDAVNVNFMQYKIIIEKEDGSEKINYINSWVTDIIVTEDNITKLANGGRCRWKCENECFNTLKNQGYFLEHNYGHGKKNLCFNFYILTLLAFYFHQIFELTDLMYQACRKKFGSKRHLWEKLRSYVCIIVFKSWRHLLDFALSPTAYIPEHIGQAPLKN